MNQQLPNIVVNGRIYTPALSLEENIKYLQDNFEAESFPLSEIVPDLQGQAIQTCYKLDPVNETYSITFFDKDEFPCLAGYLYERDEIDNLLVLTYELKQRLKDMGVTYWSSGCAWFRGIEPKTMYDQNY